MSTVMSRPGHACRGGLVLLGAAVLVAGCALVHSGPPEINGLSYKCVVGQLNWQRDDFRHTQNGRVYQITITNQTGKDVQLNGHEMAQFSASGKQVYLDVFTDQQSGSSGQLMNTQYIAPGSRSRAKTTQASTRPRVERMISPGGGGDGRPVSGKQAADFGEGEHAW